MSFSEQYKDSLTLITAQNTPFAWFNLNLPMTSMAFAERLLAEERLLVMPAEVFGYTQGIRVTYARDAAQLQEGFKRIGNLLDSVAYK
nr:aminotransferase class I/II-fold pyridoxal phosphate-dependent enzyme [Pseudomonas sp. PIA16]